VIVTRENCVGVCVCVFVGDLINCRLRTWASLAASVPNLTSCSSWLSLLLSCLCLVGSFDLIRGYDLNMSEWMVDFSVRITPFDKLSVASVSPALSL